MTGNIGFLRSLAIVCAALLLLITAWSPLCAQEIKPRGVVIWDGEIVISRQARADYEDNKSKGGHVYEHFEKRRVNDVMTIKACGSKEHLHVYSAKRTLEDWTEKGTNAVADSTNCGIPEELIQKHGPMYASIHFDPVIKQPGSKSFKSEKMYMEPVEGGGIKSLEETTAVTLMMMGDDTYTLSVRNISSVILLQDHIFENYNACNGKTKRGEHYIRPADEDHPPSFSSDITDLDWEGTKTTRQFIPALPFPAGFGSQGTVKGPMVEGTHIYSERKSDVKGGYDITTTSMWKLKAKDPCPDVYKQLMEDIAFAEAYVDPTIPPMVSLIIGDKQRIAAYEKLVDQAAWQILHGEEPPGGDLTETDAAVGGDSSEIKGLDALQKKLADQCKHDIIFESIKVHETTHIKQYDKEKFYDEATSGSASIWGLMEVTAYLNGIQVLINWLEYNCPEINLTAAKERVRQIEKTKFSRN